jgi:ABC-type phosphonate transport system ATPase subunit
LAAHDDVLRHLELHPYLDRFPAQAPGVLYARAVWARELIKGPELILVALAGDQDAGEAALLAAVLRDYLDGFRAAALILGESLEPFYSLGQRLLILEAERLLKRPLLEHRARPLASYLPLV